MAAPVPSTTPVVEKFHWDDARQVWVTFWSRLAFGPYGEIYKNVHGEYPNLAQALQDLYLFWNLIAFEGDPPVNKAALGDLAGFGTFVAAQVQAASTVPTLGTAPAIAGGPDFETEPYDGEGDDWGSTTP